MFMNGSEVIAAAARFEYGTPMNKAARTLYNLMIWTNANSDGWGYWQKPSRAAARLMRLIDLVTVHHTGRSIYDVDVNPAEIRKAYIPIRSFCTRHGAPAAEIIVEVPK